MKAGLKQRKFPMNQRLSRYRGQKVFRMHRPSQASELQSQEDCSALQSTEAPNRSQNRRAGIYPYSFCRTYPQNTCFRN